MKIILAVSLALSLTACAGTDRYSLAEQCAHNPGCVTTMPASASSIQQVRAIAPRDAGHWEPVLKGHRKR